MYNYEIESLKIKVDELETQIGYMQSNIEIISNTLNEYLSIKLRKDFSDTRMEIDGLKQNLKKEQMKIEDLQVGMTVMLKPISEVKDRLCLIDPDSFNRKVVVFEIFKDIDRFSIKENGVGHIVHYDISAVKHIVKNKEINKDCKQIEAQYLSRLELKNIWDRCDCATIRDQISKLLQNISWFTIQVEIPQPLIDRAVKECTTTQKELLMEYLDLVPSRPKIELGAGIWVKDHNSSCWFYGKFKQFDEDGRIRIVGLKNCEMIWEEYSIEKPF